ncbi:MAG TPA: 50S ribosomal protein L5 [Candidatus Bathyarchaeota archaeon]|nr:50S ribosomal protein L5 [Candidatus Bathyarchaeota archaeon]
MAENPMREIRLGKVVVNISVGASGEPLQNAMDILEEVTGQKPNHRVAKQSIRPWGIRRGEPMACTVTLRKEKADAFLRKALTAVGHRLKARSFDRDGNFAFGIREHIDLPGTRYDPEKGIIGMDVCVSLERPGYRVARRRRARSKVGHNHRVTPEEAMRFIVENYNVEVEGRP